MLPPLVPRRLGEATTLPVHGSDGLPVTDTVVVGSDTHDGPILLVESDIVVFEVAQSHAVEIPELSEPGAEGAGD